MYTPAVLHRYPSKQYQKRESRETIFGEVTAVIDPLHPSDAVSVRLRCLNGREFQVRTRTTTNFSSLTLFDKEVSTATLLTVLLLASPPVVMSRALGAA
jgi:hypothetical protein